MTLEDLRRVIAGVFLFGFVAIWIWIAIKVFRFDATPEQATLELDTAFTTVSGALSAAVGAGTAAVLGIEVQKERRSGGGLTASVASGATASPLIVLGVLSYLAMAVLLIIAWLDEGNAAPEVVESFAIGGACQILHVVDHVIATRGTRLYLPARKEGILPGASNLRLPRSVGDRLARQAILSGREFEAGTPEGDLLCDEVVEPGAMDAAIAGRVEALTSSGLVNAAANRRMMRVAAEPLELFRTYMALYAREQAFCHFSPALIANLERNWRARERA